LYNKLVVKLIKRKPTLIDRDGAKLNESG